MSTLSNGGNTWSTKIMRIKELAIKDKSMVFNNIGHLINTEFLIDCFNSLDGKKAIGTDGITKEFYRRDLDANIKKLLSKIRRGAYTPRPARIVEIPKDNGDKRPLVISCFEDKIVQTAVARILGFIFEPVFLPCSFGFRPKRSAHDAVTELYRIMDNNPKGAVVDIDIRKYFNSVPIGPLMNMIEKKISDNRFLGLLHKLIVMPLADNSGKISLNTLGVPQGSIVSPILSNIYLHHVIDEWILSLKSYFKKAIDVVRFADDMVFLFEDKLEAQAFYRTLPKRLAKFGLEVAAEKSSILPSGNWAIGDLLKKRKGMPKFKFLGFEVLWTRARMGRFRPRFKPRQDRMNKRLLDIKMFLAKNRTHPNHMTVLRQVNLVLRGWMQYFAISDCGKYIRYFSLRVRMMIHKWFNRRGKTGCVDWNKVNKILVKLKFHQYIPLRKIFPNTFLRHRANAVLGSVMP